MRNGFVALFSMPGGTEWLVILVIGLLLFGRRLPDVARSVGKSIVEFKRGLKDVSREIEDRSDEPGRAPQIESKPSDREPAQTGSQR